MYYENYTKYIKTHSLIKSAFLDFVRCLKLSFKNTTFRNPVLLLSSCNEAPNLMDSLDRGILLHWVP